MGRWNAALVSKNGRRRGWKSPLKTVNNGQNPFSQPGKPSSVRADDAHLKRMKNGF